MKRLALIAFVVACNKGSESERVVLPPPSGDCQLVAEVFASFDLGNYAEPEDRAPVVAKYRLDCERANVTKEQSDCVSQQRDKVGAAQCVPKMLTVHP